MLAVALVAILINAPHTFALKGAVAYLVPSKHYQGSRKNPPPLFASLLLLRSNCPWISQYQVRTDGRPRLLLLLLLLLLRLLSRRTFQQWHHDIAAAIVPNPMPTIRQNAVPLSALLISQNFVVDVIFSKGTNCQYHMCHPLSFQHFVSACMTHCRWIWMRPALVPAAHGCGSLSMV